jgi:hypothetical protein
LKIFRSENNFRAHSDCQNKKIAKNKLGEWIKEIKKTSIEYVKKIS